MKPKTPYQQHHYGAGFKAFSEGRTHCPYRRNSVAWKAWTAGNWDARFDQ